MIDCKYTCAALFIFNTTPLRQIYRLKMLQPHPVCPELYLRYAIQLAKLVVIPMLPCELPSVTVRPSNDGLCVDRGVFCCVLCVVSLCVV
jgi:hypothetical protein